MLSCEKPPDYSKTPVIRFESIQKIYIPGATANLSGRDSIIIALYFEDGDGDLGITQADAEADKYAIEKYGNKTFIEADTSITPADTEFVGGKMQIFPPDTTITPAKTVYNHVNFYIDEFKKVNGEFIRVEADGSKGGRFEPLLNTGRKGPIDGVLEHNFVWVHGSIFNQGVIGIADTVRFEVHVLDRDLNVSNTVVTDEIVVLVKE